ncbi:acyltransferase family protein [Streptomyces rimosus]|uniref:acyltransferase family protein n=1 Tax=Streptomyces rimosus TaxID=1927 RepID=UPI0037D7D6B2
MSLIPPTAPSATPTPLQAKLPSLTGLRFIAAALVFLFHASLTYMPMNPFADEGIAEGFHWLFSKAGWMGVSFFFVLSGFVLTWSARPQDSVTAFWRRRLLKIFPNHLATWALAMVLFAGVMTPAAAWLPSLFLVHSWFPDPAVHLSANQPAWSLCSELLFYLLFPFIIRPLVKIRANRLWGWAAAMVVGMVAVQLVTDFLAPASPPAPGTPVTVWQWWIGYNFPPLRLFEFVLGMLLARLVREGRFPAVRILPATVLVLAGYALALAVPFLYGLNVATIVPVSVLICAVAMADTKGTPTVLRSRTMQWLGEVSFAFYLAHYVVLYFSRTALMGRQVYGTAAAVAEIAGTFLATLLLGWLLLVCVERPVMRRWARPRRAPALTPPAPAEAAVHAGGAPVPPL